MTAVTAARTLFADADACPSPARTVILRTARRAGLRAVFVANREIPGIAGAGAVMEVCPAEDGAADDRIAEMAQSGDAAVTRDVGLASRLVAKGVTTLDDRGRFYTRESIAGQMARRDFTVALAESGVEMQRPVRYGRRETAAFAAALEKALAN